MVLSAVAHRERRRQKQKQHPGNSKLKPRTKRTATNPSGGKKVKLLQLRGRSVQVTSRPQPKPPRPPEPRVKLTPLFPHPTPLPPPPLQKPLLDFVPIHGKNVFTFSPPSGPASRNSNGSKIVALKFGEVIAFSGAIILTPLLGDLSAYGATLRPSSKNNRLRSYPIFAPSISAFPTFSPASERTLSWGKDKDDNLLDGLLTESLGEAFKARISSTRSFFSAVFKVQDVSNNGDNDTPAMENLHFLESTWSRGILWPKSEPSSQLFLRSFANGLYGKTWQALPSLLQAPIAKIPPSWREAFSQATALSKEASTSTGGQNNNHCNSWSLLVRGPRQAGKSTFARMMINNLLQQFDKVAYLETDLGQSEFGPPGVVGLSILENPLFGPPFTHNHHPYHRSHFLGDLSPKTSPDLYLSSIKDLVETYERDFDPNVKSSRPRPRYLDEEDDDTRFTSSSASHQEGQFVPLIVNTHGWIRGLGWDLIESIISFANPSLIYTFQPSPPGQMDPTPGPTAAPFIPPSPYASSNAVDVALEPMGVTSGRWNPVDFRELGLLSYFHKTFVNDDDDDHLSTLPVGSSSRQSSRLQQPLFAQPPYCVDWRTLTSIRLSVNSGDEVFDSDALAMLNGSFVGILTSEQPVTQAPASHSSSSALSELDCLGLGLIRSIDVQARRLFILTPIPPSRLINARILVKSNFETPMTIMAPLQSLLLHEDPDRQPGSPAPLATAVAPYIDMDWDPRAETPGSKRRQFRRNLLRRETKNN